MRANRVRPLVFLFCFLFKVKVVSDGAGFACGRVSFTLRVWTRLSICEKDTRKRKSPSMYRTKETKNWLRAAALRTRFYDIDCKCIYQ